MKNFIYNYYNIYVDNIDKRGDDYYFVYDNDTYVISFIYNEDTFNEIYNVIIRNNLDFFKAVNNKDNSLVSLLNEKKYVLLKMHGIYNYEIVPEDFNNILLENKDGLNWGVLWSNKIDYYEKQIKELGINHQTILNTFGFFEGLAENAILYFNLTIERVREEKTISICHNRMNYPCYLIEHINPTKLVIDYSIRDISEYIKSYIFYEKYDIQFVIDLLSSLNTNSLMFNLLYSRLMYPNFYFDSFEDIIINKASDDEIIKSINIIDRYIYLLEEIYTTFGKKYNMMKIEWIEKIKM